MMNSIPWYRSEVITVGLTAFLAQIATMFNEQFLTDLFEGKPGALARTIAAVLTALVVALRAVNNVQPVTLTKVAAEKANKEGGFARPLMLAFLLASAVIVLPVMQGCSVLGVAQPVTFDQKYAYALAQITAARNAGATALEARQISLADAQYLLKTTDQARAYLDTAKQVYDAGETAKGQTSLQLATSVLASVQTFLNNRGAK